MAPFHGPTAILTVEEIMNHGFTLSHVHRFDEGGGDWKLIGVFSSLQKAQEAQDRAVRRPGFSDTPDGFEISRFAMVGENGGEVYLLFRIIESADGDEDVSVLGGYPSLEEAEAEENRREREGGPGRLEIAAYDMDRESWLEGYFTLHPSDD